MIVDTGMLLALANTKDRHHKDARAVFSLAEPRILTEPIIVETDWMLESRLGVEAELAFLRSLDEGSFVIESPRPVDRARAADLIERYASAGIGYVDAMTTAIAERLREHRIATIDARHFRMITPAHVSSFEILP